MDHGMSRIGGETTPSPIRLFAHDKDPNVGDLLSKDVVGWVARGPWVRASVSDCNLIAIGSIYPWLKRSWRRRLRVVHVWGSGMLQYYDGQAADSRIVVHAARGPLTAMAMRRSPRALGDPGVLADRTFGVSRAEGWASARPGLILHLHQHQHMPQADIDRLSEIYEVIDMRTHDVRGTLERIAGCSAIYSSSLHGLVMADAVGVPNALVAPYGGEAPSGKPLFKYYDYALSVDRTLGAPAKVADLVAGPPPLPPQADPARLEAVKDALIRSFPFEVADAAAATVARPHPATASAA
ncbi:Polysaccharide pyruvyl transferase [Albimonas pacifica]|uniref:Polysaccharide pyruvyl transferase n=1 Tax=Albimonas pacifica TaxID=1114924 RepID=A0A1I3D737_9RHOB|nr:polysaccharide pyruvyl transferase family protein [Albimonas pacifica]SFH82525.1 Polysaccharide pyruvyl transferase [Albimonas pacifica]